jgi:hypothetical protein
MTTPSGTYNFDSTAGEVVSSAFRRCGVHLTELTAQHMWDASQEANMLMAAWAGDGINLWQVEQGAQVLTQGTTSYAMPVTTVFLLDCFIATGTSPRTDRLIFPISRSDYDAIAVKSTQGAPTSFWFDRLISPSIYLWPTPDGSGPYTLYYHYMRQAQDSVLSGGLDLDLPWYYIDAFCSGLAARLSVIYAPDRADRLIALADKAWIKALDVGTENVPAQIIPQMRGYFR